MTKLRQILFALFVTFLFVEIVFIFPAQLESGDKSSPSNTPLENSQSESEQKEDGKSPRKESNTLITEQKMEGVHLVESKAGSRDWELYAESGRSTQGDGSWVLSKVKILFYNSDKVDFTVTGQSGSIDGKSKNIKINGDVVTKSSNGYVFYSEAVLYNAGQRLITSPDAIRMVGPPDGKVKGMTLNGAFMETRVDQKLMKIHQNVVAQKTMPDGKNFMIKSREAEFSGENRLAHFLGDVSIDVGSLKLEGPEANFEYRPGADLLQSVVVKGGVKVSDMDKFATSDTVKFDPEQNKFTFNGRPRVVQNNDEITGDQIIFIDGGKKVKVEKVKAKVEQ